MLSDRYMRQASSSETAGKPYALVVLLQLHWFIRLRWLFAVGALAVLGVERFVFPEAERPWQLLAVVLCVALSNLIWIVVSQLLHRQLAEPIQDQARAIRSGQMFASAQIVSDLLLLTCILTLTGGVANPASLFYLFHVAITGLLLRTWQAFLLSCWAVLLYAGMCFGQALGWLPYYPFLPHVIDTGLLHAEVQYVSIVVVMVGLAVFGTLYFTDRIGHILDQREDMLIKTNAALQQSQQAIEDLQQRRSRFMQVAAHQLKSPLAMVQTLANLILDDIVTDKEGIKATCEKIVRRAREGIGQVGELLALARVQEADPRRHQESRCDVGNLVDDLCRKHLSVARDKRIELTWDIPDCPELVAFVEQTDLADCAGNLIENAIKYTPEDGQVRVRVLCGSRVSAEERAALPPPPARLGTEHTVSDYVYVIVRDTGIGLGDASSLVKDGVPTAGSIFDAFRRGNAALTAGIPGTGLGLSIVREVVEQAHGYLHVLSKPGAGSTFTVAFPARCCREPTVEVRDTRSSQIVVERGLADAREGAAAEASEWQAEARPGPSD